MRSGASRASDMTVTPRPRVHTASQDALGRAFAAACASGDLTTVRACLDELVDVTVGSPLQVRPG